MVKTRIADPDPDYFGKLIRIRIRVKSWIWIRINGKNSGLKMKPWRTVDPHNVARILKKGPWRVCRPVVANSHHFNSKQDRDPDPHESDAGPQPWT